MTASEADPPDDIPGELIAGVQTSADSQLREITNRYGTDIALSNVGAAHDKSVAGSTPRAGSRLRTLVTGEGTHTPVRSTEIPVLPGREASDL